MPLSYFFPLNKYQFIALMTVGKLKLYNQIKKDEIHVMEFCWLACMDPSFYQTFCVIRGLCL